MITQEHAQEQLSRAYVTAIAAIARFNLKLDVGFDYGVDGTFELVTKFVDARGRRMLLEEGLPLRFQLKATTDCRGNDTHINYDCKVKAYNKIVRQNQTGGVRTILLVLCLPGDEKDWLAVTEDALMLRKACYWYYLTGPQTTNEDERAIAIPRLQLFTPAALTGIMNRIQAGGTP